MKMVVHHLKRDNPYLWKKGRGLRNHIHHKHKILLPRKKQRRILPRSICVPIRSAIPKCRLAIPLPFFEYAHNLHRISFRPPKARFPGGNAARIQFLRPNANPPDELPFSVTFSGQTGSSLSQTVSRIMALTILLVTPSPTVGNEISFRYLFGQGAILTVSSSLSCASASSAQWLIPMIIPCSYRARTMFKTSRK